MKSWWLVLLLCQIRVLHNVWLCALPRECVPSNGHFSTRTRGAYAEATPAGRRQFRLRAFACVHEWDGFPIGSDKEKGINKWNTFSAGTLASSGDLFSRRGWGWCNEKPFSQGEGLPPM